MRKCPANFVPSRVLDGIYNIINNSLCIAGNEDVYFDDIIWAIVRYCEENYLVSHFLWEDCRNETNDGGMLFISWVENNVLYHEHFKYQDIDEDMRYKEGERHHPEEKDLTKECLKKIIRGMH